MDQYYSKQGPPPSSIQPYLSAYGENVALVVEMLEAMRVEAELVGDVDSARFWEGVINVIAAFRLRNSPRRGLRPVAR